MMEEFRVAHGAVLELFLQKRSELMRVTFFRFRRRLVRKRSFKRGEFGASQLVVEPRGPLFFKRFHRDPSIGSAVFSARRKVST